MGELIRYVFLSLISGALFGYFNILSQNLLDNISQVLLLALGFIIGIDIGVNKHVFKDLKQTGFKVLLIPASVIIGSLGGAAAVSTISDLALNETLAIGSGMGFYSLTTVLVTSNLGPQLGTIAFVANILRELITFATTAFLSKYSKNALVVMGGATAMDTTLPIIKKYGGRKVGLIAVISGFIITLLVPVLVPFFANL